ncbi:MAG: L,D-transpeptidase family protein [Eubacteriales bacterium]|nr:L,D-transpeptidase family protein [Eubacteriales bacterium]
MGKKKIIAIVILVLCGLVGGAYAGGRYYFTSHFYPRTSINGVDVSMKTKEEAITAVKEELNNYRLGIHSADGDMIISAEQCALEYTDTKPIEQLLEAQNEDLWFTEAVFVHENKAMGLKLDEAKLRETVQGLSCMTPAEPKESTDARIEYDEASKSFVIIPETIGNIVEPDVFFEGVKKAVLAGEGIVDLRTSEYYVQPKYFAKDKLVTDTKAELDKYLATTIHYEDFGLTYDMDPEVIHTFIQVDKNFKIIFDKELMKTYIQENISPVFNTVGTERIITSPGSGSIKVSGGTYGWQVGLIDEREAMIKDFQTGGNIVREPAYLQDALVKDRTNDVGDTFVDVNIAQQKLWYVKKGKVVLQSDFVSGDCTNGHDTNQGIYQVERKERNYHMKDYNVTVSYWMPFNLDFGEGFHDASWRGSFGGSIYEGNGSHGCVNLPPKVAQEMFKVLEVGCPVLVHE